MSASAGDEQPDENTLLEILERYRGRARALAGLTATAAAGIAAGLVFTPPDAGLSPWAIWVGFGCLCSLVISVAFLGRAQIVTKDEDDDADAGATGGDARPASKAAHEALKVVWNSTRWGGRFGFLALMLFVAMAFLVGVGRDTHETVRLYVGEATLDELRGICPALVAPVVGEVDKRTLQGDAGRIAVLIRPQRCGLDGDEGVTLFVAEEDLRGWADVGG